MTRGLIGLLLVSLLVFGGCATATKQMHRLELLEAAKGAVGTVTYERRIPYEGDAVQPRASGIARLFEAPAVLVEAIGNSLENVTGLGFITDTIAVISGDTAQVLKDTENAKLTVELEEDTRMVSMQFEHTDKGVIVRKLMIEKISDSLNADPDAEDVIVEDPMPEPIPEEVEPGE